jgi:hypothetical protein
LDLIIVGRNTKIFVVIVEVCHKYIMSNTRRLLCLRKIWLGSIYLIEKQVQKLNEDNVQLDKSRRIEVVERQFFFKRLNFINNVTERKTSTVHKIKRYTNSSQKKNFNHTNNYNQLFTKKEF